MDVVLIAMTLMLPAHGIGSTRTGDPKIEGPKPPELLREPRRLTWRARDHNGDVPQSPSCR